jgi:RNA polymerase sigma factor (sigma-70 family)
LSTDATQNPSRNDPPVTLWIAAAKDRDPEAEQSLWNHYFQRVIRYARSRMFVLQGTVYDEEDAAVSALNSLFRGMQTSRFPRLDDRHNFWRLLTLITKRKMRAQWRRESADRRSKPSPAVITEEISIHDIISDDPTPDFVAQMMDETEHLLSKLDDERLRRIAVMKLDGLTNDEIAERLQCATRTVQRKMDLIRDQWHIEEG